MDVVVHRDIRYAHAARFCPPEPCAAGERGQVTGIAPQNPSRLETVMGRPEVRLMSEDCLGLTITAPARSSPAGHPVLVWLHGGAYVTGSGSWSCYDASRLVAETGIVVVAVSHRLGVLGYMRARGISQGNLGLRDQIAALEWVRENIAEFGGDPQVVTVAGQSAGAHAVVAMLSIPATRGLFRRVILHSAPLGLAYQAVADAERVGEVVLRHLAVPIGQASVEEILRAQGAAASELAASGVPFAPPFLPIAGVDPWPSEGAAEPWDGVGDLDVMLGNTTDEFAAFLGRRTGPEFIDGFFDGATTRFADKLAVAGARVFRFRVGELDPGAPLGACHCIDLPLLFGDEAAWRNAPMLSPPGAAAAIQLGTSMRADWAAFARSGVPESERWSVHRPGQAAFAQLP